MPGQANLQRTSVALPGLVGGSDEREDALDWSTRAQQSYQLALEDSVYEARYHNFCEGENSWQTALDHAGRSDDAGFLLKINEDIERWRQRALVAIQTEG
ncbi:MAG: hypothetical protein WC876_02775 [Candidatus Thermoplasmatota archaeon]|jgi:hypothetical protein